MPPKKPTDIIHITTGDADGIGLEVALKALNKVGPTQGVQFKLWRAVEVPKRAKERLSALSRRFLDTNGLADCARMDTPVDWVEQAAVEILAGSGALVTGPLSKTLIAKTGRAELGHNEILKRITNSSLVKMFFIGNKFNVFLATGHTPLSLVEKELSTSSDLMRLLDLALKARQTLPAPLRRKKIGLLGLNPHAGEDGLLGDFEVKLASLVKKDPKYQGAFSQILVPDVAFQKKYWDDYAFYFAFYHDQGLIPFKMSHGQSSGLQVSLGLPFLRVSVDHGTAKDIFNKNIADAGSMTEAIRFAIGSIKRRR